MAFSLPRRLLACVLSCVCAGAFLLLFQGSPAHAVNNRVTIHESFVFYDMGLLSYELWVFDSSGTITEDSCKALPQARNNAQTTYSTDPQRKTCSIKASFFTLNNPYVEASEDGAFTFVTRPLRFEDFKVSFPEGTSYLTRDLSFAGISLKISKMSPGGTVSNGPRNSVHVQWSGDLGSSLAAVGTFSPTSDFRSTRRVSMPEVAPDELPTDLEVVATPTPSTQATPRATRTQRSSSVPPTHTPLVDIDGDALIKKIMGLSVFVFAAFGVYSIWNAKQRQDAQKSHPQSEAKVDEQLSDDHAEGSSSPRSPFVLPPEERIPTPPESSAQSGVTPDDPSSSPRSRFAPPTN